MVPWLLYAEPGQQVEAGTTPGNYGSNENGACYQGSMRRHGDRCVLQHGDLVDGGADLLTFEAADPPT